MAKVLTDLAIQAIKPKGKRQEIADPRIDGLFLIVQPTGTKGWTYRYRYGRKARRISLGTYPAIDMAKARTRAEAAVHALERGEDPSIALFGPKREQYLSTADREAFGNLIRRFMHEHAIPSTRSWKETARLLGLTVTEHKGKPPTFEDKPGGIVARWSERPVGGIKRRDISEMLGDSLARGATVTANRELAAVRKFFSWCLGKSIIEVNPALGLPNPAPERRRDRVLSDDELRLIWLAADGEGFAFGDLVKLLLLTGQRRREVSFASWPEFDLKVKHWLIPSSRTKNKRQHLVPLSNLALNVLTEMPRFQGGTFLFGLGGSSGFSGYSKATARFNARIAELTEHQVKPWTIHDLRRTLATTMARLGVMPHVVEAVLNHISGSKAGVAGIYNVWAYEPEKRAALNLWATHIEKITDPDREAEDA